MKRMMALLLCCLLLAVLNAGAEEQKQDWSDYTGTMIISNCNEWVSLREKPDTNAKRLCKVNLGELVLNCSAAENGFFACEYDEMKGYILATYLEPFMGADDSGADFMPADLSWDEMSLVGAEVLKYQHGTNTILAVRTTEMNEMLQVGCFDAQHRLVWGYITYWNDLSELNATDAFIAGPADQPCVMIYNSCIGLSCVDIADGSEKWRLQSENINIGGGARHLVDTAGTIFMVGYYNSKPTAITPDGQMKWQTVCDSWWPYGMENRGETIAILFEMNNDGEANTLVFNKSNGELVK